MTEQEIKAAAAREDVCRYLAACFYEPDAAFEEEGMFSALLDAAKQLDASLGPYAQRLGEQFRATKIDTLLLDYTRLFLGPMDILAKPYGSVWLDEEKTLMGESTMAVLELYREADFEMDEEFKELPDHIAAELEFLYLLIFRENEARQGGDAAKTAFFIDLQQRFLTRHLGAWVGNLASAIKANAQCDFYCELADLASLFVSQEMTRLKGISS